MTIEKTLTEGTLTLKFEGWLDTTSAQVVDAELENLEKDFSILVFDFDKLEYISSAGLRKIAMAAKITKEIEADFKIINVGETVMNVLDMTSFSLRYDVTAKR